MSIPKSFKRAFITLVVMLAMVASAAVGVDFGLASASAATAGVLEGTNFVLSSPVCGTVHVSFDYVGGPDTWTIDRDPAGAGVQVASGAVSNATGSVRGIVITGQPAGSNEYALYGSRGGQPAAPRASVTVKGCTTPPPPSDTKVTPTAPTFVDKVGTKNDTYTVPSTVGVKYTVSGVVVAAGIYPAKGTVTVVAKAKTGFVLKGTSTWTFEFTNVVPVPPKVVINPSGKVTVDRHGNGTATFNNTKSNTVVGFELVLNGNVKSYSVKAGAVKHSSFSGAKCGSKVIVQDGEANRLASATVAKCAVVVVVKKPPVIHRAPTTVPTTHKSPVIHKKHPVVSNNHVSVAPVTRSTSGLPVPVKVQTDGGQLMSSTSNESGILPLGVGFGLIAGGLLYMFRRREARS